MVQVSEDIFYQVKKQILDKLDVILQKVNLEIINYLHPQEDSFSFIELSSFEHEITHLFTYLDRFYASLNTSVSFSSINSFKSSVENYHAENHRLAQENQRLHKTIEELTQKSPYDLTFNRDRVMTLPQSEALLRVREVRQKAGQAIGEFKVLGREVKKALKKFKFDFLELRVEVISRLKDFQERSQAQPQRQSQLHPQEGLEWQQHGQEDGEQILQAINDVLLLC